MPDTATITSGNVNIVNIDKRNSDNDGEDFIVMVRSFQESDTALVAPDYNDCGSDNNMFGRASYTPIIEGSDRIDIGDIIVDQYSNWALNANGLSWISKTGWTKFGVREGHDVLDHPVLEIMQKIVL